MKNKNIEKIIVRILNRTLTILGYYNKYMDYSKFKTKMLGSFPNLTEKKLKQEYIIFNNNYYPSMRNVIGKTFTYEDALSAFISSRMSLYNLAKRGNSIGLMLDPNDFE